MTIAAGFKFHRGLLLCADAQHTYSGAMKINNSKIVRADLSMEGGSQLVFALSGNVSYAHMGIDHCIRKIKGMKAKARTAVGLRLALEDGIEKFHQAHIYQHPGFHAGVPTFQLLIGVRSEIDTALMLYATSDSAVTAVRDYECVGSGSFLAHYLIPTIFRHKSLPLKDAANIAIHVLRETKDYVDGCGGNSEFVVLDAEGSISRITSYDISTGETLSRDFRDAMRRLFVISADLEATPEKINEEFEMAKLIIEACRKKQLAERPDRAFFVERLSTADSLARWLASQTAPKEKVNGSDPAE